MTMTMHVRACSLLVGLGVQTAALNPVMASDFAHLFQSRTDTMNAIDKSVKVIADMVRGRKDFNSIAAAEAAASIASNARTLPGLFPPGSNLRPSEARSEIWREWDRFTMLADRLAADADALAQSAETAARIRQGLASVGSHCTNCHNAFRVALSP